jgi:hypothetical protein
MYGLATYMASIVFEIKLYADEFCALFYLHQIDRLAIIIRKLIDVEDHITDLTSIACGDSCNVFKALAHALMSISFPAFERNLSYHPWIFFRILSFR